MLSINTLRDKGLLKGSNDFLIDGEGGTGDEQQITELNSTAETLQWDRLSMIYVPTCGYSWIYEEHKQLQNAS